MEKYKEEKLKENPKNLCANCGELAVREVNGKYQSKGWCNMDCQNKWLDSFSQ